MRNLSLDGSYQVAEKLMADSMLGSVVRILEDSCGSLKRE